MGIPYKPDIDEEVKRSSMGNPKYMKDFKEKEDLKAVLLMLLIVVCAIFLLGMGKQRIRNKSIKYI